MIKFPRTTVGGISCSRMIIGSNWIGGWSHTSVAADHMITRTHHCADSVVPMLVTAIENGVDTFMGMMSDLPIFTDAARRAEEITGHKMVLIDTPILNVDDSKDARAIAKEQIAKSKAVGSDFCLLHHSCAEQLVNKNKGIIDRLDDYTTMIREAGMVPGLSAHMPELILYSDANGYDVETYIQLYNCMGFLMQIEVESVARIIHNAKKPVMTIKPMAAGRCSPYVGLNFSWNTLRDCDMVTVGCLNEEEMAEDIEISLAAIERRLPDLTARSSPNKKQAVLK